MTQQSTDVTLESCPFCGGNHTQIVCHPWKNSKSFETYVLCGPCQIGGPSCIASEKSAEICMINAVRLWNTRATLSKPVGEVMSAEDFVTHWSSTKDEPLNTLIKLIKARDSQLAQPPEGYAVVPIEPTEAMKDAGYNAGSPRFSEPSPPEIYRAMIAAAKGGKDV